MARISYRQAVNAQKKLDKRTLKEASDAIKSEAAYKTSTGHIAGAMETADTNAKLYRVAQMAAAVRSQSSKGSKDYRQANRLFKSAVNSENRYRESVTKMLEERARSGMNRANERMSGGTDTRTNTAGTRYENAERAGIVGDGSYNNALMNMSRTRQTYMRQEDQRKQENARKAYLEKYGDVENMSYDELRSRIKNLEDRKARNAAIRSTDELPVQPTTPGLTPVMPWGTNARQTPSRLTQGQRERLAADDARADEFLEVYKKALPDAALRDEEKKLSEEEKKIVRAVANEVRKNKQAYATVLDPNMDPIENNKKLMSSLQSLKDRGVDTDYLVEAYSVMMDNEEAEMDARASKEFAQENALNATLSSIATALASPATMVSGISEDVRHAIRNTIGDKPVPINQKNRWLSNNTEAIRSGVSENIENPVWNFIYNAGMSAADSAMSILAGSAAGGAFGAGAKAGTKATQLIMSAGAADSTYNEAIERGIDPMSALATAVTAGVTEAVTERYSIDNLKALATKTPKTLKSLVMNIGRQMVTEGSEEAASDVLNTISDNIINGKKSAYEQSVRSYLDRGLTEEQARKAAMMDWLGNTAYDAAAGAFSGALMGVGGQALSFKQVQDNFSSYGEMVHKTGDINKVIEYAKKFGDLSEEAEKLEKVKFTDKESVRAGRLADDLQSRIDERINEATNAVELTDTYNELSEDAPDIVRANIDDTVLRKIEELKNTSDSESEQYVLSQIGEEARGSLDERMSSLSEKLGSNESETKDETAEENRNETVEENRNETKVEPRILKNNRAALSASGERVAIDGFVNAGTEDAMVRIDGTDDTVPVDDLTFDDPRVEGLYHAAATMDDTAAASALISNYDGKVAIDNYFEDFEKAYNWGSIGYDFNEMYKRTPFRISKSVAYQAFSLGENAYKANVEAIESRSQAIRSGQISFRQGEGKVVDERMESEDLEKGIYENIDEKLAKKLGINIREVDQTHKDINEKINGFLDINNAEMVFSDAAQSDFGVRIHESLEFLDAVDPGTYNHLMKFVLDYAMTRYSDTANDDIYKTIMAYRETYRGVEGSKTFAEAAGEYLNDAVSGVFFTEEGARDFIEWLNDEDIKESEKKGILQTIIDIIDKLVSALSDALKRSNMTRAQRHAASVKLETQKEIRQMFFDTMEQGVKQYKGSAGESADQGKAASAKAYSARADINDKYVKEVSLSQNNRKIEAIYDVLEAYKKENAGKIGKITRDSEKYRDDLHLDEINGAKALSKLGIDVILRQESDKEYVKNPDYEIFKSLWDLKNPKSESSTNKRVQEGFIQIAENPGGVVLDFGNKDIDMDEMWRQVENRINVSGKADIGVFIIRNGEVVGAREYKLKKETTPRPNEPSPASNNNIAHSEEKASEISENGKKSLSLAVDTEGRELTPEQREFFKDSKAVDSEGRLLTLYHQTEGGFTVFDTRKKGAGASDNGTPYGIFLKTGSGDIGLKGKNQMKLYANITNPLVVNDRDQLTYKLVRMSPEYESLKAEYDNMDKKYGDIAQEIDNKSLEYMMKWIEQNPDKPRTDLYDDEGYKKIDSDEENNINEWNKEADKLSAKMKETLTQALRDNGYDGVFISSDKGSFRRSTDAFIALDAEQVKNVNNTTPTGNPDIRYSIHVPFDEQKVDNTARRIMAEVGITDKTLSTYKTGKKMIEYAKNRYLSTEDNPHPISVKNFEKKVYIYSSGIKETFGNDDFIKGSKAYKRLKIACMEDIENIIENATVTKEHKKSVHEGSNKMYTYLEGKAEFGGEEYKVHMDCQEVENELRFHIHKIEAPDKSSFPNLAKSGASVNSISGSRKNASEISKKGKKSFSLTVDTEGRELTPEQRAVDHFGITDDYRVAGYMLPDGSMLDFSGSHWMEGASKEELARFHRDNEGVRQVNHEDIFEVMEATGDNRKQFMDRGNIRLSPEAPGINISATAEPTTEQYRGLKEFIRNVKNNKDFNDSFYVDIEDSKPNKISYSGNISEDRIVSDIKNYFKTGKMPEQSSVGRFHFSIDVDTRELIRENTQLKEMVKHLEHEFELTGGREADPEKVKRVAKKFLKAFNSSYDLDTLADQIMNIYSYLHSENGDGEVALAKMSEVARSILKEGGDKVEGEYKDLRDYLRTTGISLSEAQKEEAANIYGSYGAFRRAMFGKVKLVNGGADLERVWNADLKNLAPELFLSDVNALNMPAVLADTVDAIQPRVIPYGTEDVEQGAYDVAMQIYVDLAKVPPVETFADKQEKRYHDGMMQLSESYERLLEAYRKEIDELNGADIEGAKKQFEEEKMVRLAKNTSEMKAILEAKKQAKNPKTLADYEKQFKRLEAENQRIRAAKANEVAAIKAKYNNKRLSDMDRRKSTEIKDKIRKLHEKMRRMIVKPTETAYVPKDLMAAAIEVCNIVDLGYAEGSKLRQALDEARRAFPNADKEDGILASDFDPRIVDEIDSLAELFDNKPEGWSIKDATLEELNRIYESMKGVYECIRMSTKLIREEGEKDARRAGKRVIKELEESKGLNTWFGKLWDKINTPFLNSYREFRKISGYNDGGEIMYIWKELNDGQKKMYRTQMEGQEVLQKAFGSKEMDKLLEKINSSKDLVKVPLKFKSGNAPVMITRGMRLSLIMHGMSPSNYRHMSIGGVEIPVNMKVIDNKKKAYEQTRRVVGIDYTTLKQMEMELSSEEKQLLEVMKELFHDWSGEKINETSNELYGFERARVKNYFPITVDKDYVATDISALKFDKTIEGAGFLKERIQSVKPIILENIMDTADRTIKATSLFNGLAVPVRNYNKIMNTSTFEVTEADEGDGEIWVPNTSVKKMLKDKWGVRTQQFLDDLVADLQQARSRDFTWYDRLRGNYAGAVLTANASVIIKQTSAYPTVAGVVGWMPTVKAMFRGGKSGLPISKADTELINKYSSLYWYRNQGNNSRDLAEIRDMNSFVNKIPPVKFTKDLIQKVDIAMVGRFWYAAQYYVDKNHKNLQKGSDAYYRKVAEYFDKAIEETQSTNMVMENADIMRNPSGGMKMITMFMGQGLQNFGIVYDNLANMRAKARQVKEGKATKTDLKQARKDFANALSSQLVSAAMFAGLAIVARGLLHRMNPYRDDKEEITPESVAGKFLDDMAENMAGSVPFGSLIYETVMTATDIASGKGFTRVYGQQDVVLEGLSNLENSIARLSKAIKDVTDGDKGSDAVWEALNQTFKDGSKLIGVPYENVWNLGEGIYKHVQDVVNGDGFLSYSSDQKNPSVKVIGGYLSEAIEKGDTFSQEKYAEILYELGKSDKEINSKIAENIKGDEAIINAALERINGNIGLYSQTVTEYVKKGYPEAAVVGAINSIMNKKKNEGKDDTKPDAGMIKKENGSFMNSIKNTDVKIYDGKDLTAAVETGSVRDINTIINTMIKDKTASGMPKEEAAKKVATSAKSILSREYHQTYISSNPTERSKIINKLSKVKLDGKPLYTQENFLKWNKEAEKSP